MPFVELLERKAKTKSAELIYQYLSKEEKHIKKGDLYFWDALAAAIVTNKEICKFKTYSLSVVTKEGTESGWTRQDPKGMPIDVCIKADGKEFEDIFIKTINNPENKI
jgi:inosine-uridine nucleoside N-ribohydrolase